MNDELNAIGVAFLCVIIFAISAYLLRWWDHFLGRTGNSKPAKEPAIPSAPTLQLPTAKDAPRAARSKDGNLSAAQAMEVVRSLYCADAQWSRILTVLNPANDLQIAEMLDVIRGPHLFAPQTALGVIQHGIDLAQRDNPWASFEAALRYATMTMDPFTR